MLACVNKLKLSKLFSFRSLWSSCLFSNISSTLVRDKPTPVDSRDISSQTVFGTRMLLFLVPESKSNISFLMQGLSTDAIDSGVMLLRWDNLNHSATLSEIYHGQEIPLVSVDDVKMTLLTKHPFVWHRRSDFGGKQFQAVSR